MRRLVVSVLTFPGWIFRRSWSLTFRRFHSRTRSTLTTSNFCAERARWSMEVRWFHNNWETWSAVAADTSQSDRDHEIAELVTSMDAVVISDSMKVEPGDPWAASTRVVPRAEGAQEIASLKQGSGGDLLMFGSATTWAPLFEQGLVDELIVLVGAALLGDGSKLYSGAGAGLRLLGARVLPGSQLVELRYDASNAGTDGPS